MLEHTAQQYRMMRGLFEENHLAFTRFFLQYAEGVKFIENLHHHLISNAIERVFRGECTRLIINVPPGTTKTELAVIAVVARGLLINPRARFIHASSGGVLVNENSSRIKDIINSEHFQAMRPMKIRTDADSKQLWKNEQGGGLYAVAAGGNIMGFRAGRMEDGFSGVFVYDDPTKADDFKSDLALKTTNQRFMSTIRTRLARKNTPIIVIMQRIAENDLSGFLLRGGSGDMWEHLELPVEIEKEPPPYPEEYTHGVPIEHDLPVGPMWKYKYDDEEIKKLKVDEATFWAQYMQRPQSYSGGIFHDEHWKYYDRYEKHLNMLYHQDGFRESLACKLIYADTAMKKEEIHDYSVLQCWGVGETTGYLYLLDQIRGKWESHRLKKIFMAFHDRHAFKAGENMIGVRYIKVEDKASGTGLIQDIRNDKGEDFIEGVQRNRDKVSRARDVLNPIYEGKVFLPKKAYWLGEYRQEFKEFNAYFTHNYDDQIDATVDAINDNLIEDVDPTRAYNEMVNGEDDYNSYQDEFEGALDYIDMFGV